MVTSLGHATKDIKDSILSKKSQWGGL